MNNDNDIKVEIDTKLQSNKLITVIIIWENYSVKSILKNLKVHIYTTLIRPVMLYESETWPLRKTQIVYRKINSENNFWTMDG